MNTTVTYKRTRRQYLSFVRQFFWRVAVTPLIVIILYALYAVLCWGCISMIIQLYGFFSNAGVVDIWYHLFVSLPLALFSVLFLIALIKLTKLVIKVKHSYTRQYEACPINDDQEVDVKLKIDDGGIGWGEEKVQWEEMTVGFATKDFYAFLSKRPMLICMPKYAVDAELGGYLKNQMKMINKRRRLEGRKRPKGSGPSA